MKSFFAQVIGLALASSFASGGEKESYHYLRPAGKAFATEAKITVLRDKDEWRVTSVTESGKGKMTIEARYDAQQVLLDAGAMWQDEKTKAEAKVTVTAGKAKVERVGGIAQEFMLPDGKAIVTSAPDWADIFLLCRHYDRKRGGKQSFTGLWIHPTQPAQVIPFHIEESGGDFVKNDGKDIKLHRFRIQIRGPNPYLAWADEFGKLIRLVPMPLKKDALPAGLVLAGFEECFKQLP
ncbi:MAG: hypothetical protein L0Y72_14455 [Gemmataceae bacterium]|nr:hypothetical protein [Gemmataceae bacterium]MCI0740245.1 hypothetical protein [Gemmataceae bacterium]